MNLRLIGGEADVPGSRNDTNRRTDVHKKAIHILEFDAVEDTELEWKNREATN